MLIENLVKFLDNDSNYGGEFSNFTTKAFNSIFIIELPGYYLKNYHKVIAYISNNSLPCTVMEK